MLTKKAAYSERYFEILEKRMKLPVWSQKQEFLKTFKENQMVILVGETGSGKTTQIPQFVLEAVLEENPTPSGSKWLVGCTQPRRIAATSASRRVAEEMDVEVGEEVGYTVRFEDCSSPRTVLKYLTDGMLLREAMSDPLLSRYKAIVLDETHERTLATDLLFGYLERVLLDRPDLKLVVMSEALKNNDFLKYLDVAPLIKVPGRRLHPVDIHYTDVDPEIDYLESAINTVIQIHMCEPPGDVLVFLTGEEEIEDACSRISLLLGDDDDEVKVLPLYSTLPHASLQKVFDPTPDHVRKIVVSTNIAETSLAMDGIVYVVDSGFSKQKMFNAGTRGECMSVLPISQVSADRRAGHAGRRQRGKCFRLYTEKTYDKLEMESCPEILRSNLANTALTLIKLGVEHLGKIDFMDRPAPGIFTLGLQDLYELGAVDDECHLTETGEMMSEFPLDPQMSKMLIASPQLNCSNEILSVSAMLSVPNCFIRPRGEDQKAVADEAKFRFAHIDGDHLTLLNVFQSFLESKQDPDWCYANFIDYRVMKSAVNVREQLVRIMSRFRMKLCSTDSNSRSYYVNIRKALLAGYFMQVAHLERDDHYLTVRDNKQVADLDPSCCLDHKPEWVIYNDYVLASSDFIRTVSRIRGEWLVDAAPHYYSRDNFPNSEAKRALEQHFKKKECEKKGCAYIISFWLASLKRLFCF